jgi:hypothetical protein
MQINDLDRFKLLTERAELRTEMENLIPNRVQSLNV